MNQIKLITPFFVFLLFIVGFSSCKNTIDTKEEYLEEYELFIEGIKKKKDSYSEEQWKQTDEKFAKFNEELYNQFENELSFLEQARIAKYALVYSTTRGIKALNRALEDGKVENAIDEMTDFFDKDLQNDLDNVISDLKELWDDELKDELSEKLEEIKLKLEDEKFRDDLSNRIDEIKEILDDEEIQKKMKDVSIELNELIQEIEKKVE